MYHDSLIMHCLYASCCLRNLRMFAYSLAKRKMCWITMDLRSPNTLYAE